MLGLGLGLEADNAISQSELEANMYPAPSAGKRGGIVLVLLLIG